MPSAPFPKMIREIDQLIVDFKTEAAVTLIQQIKVSAVPYQYRVQIAGLARRLNLIRFALKNFTPGRY